jgi:hypothetical protein
MDQCHRPPLFGVGRTPTDNRYTRWFRRLHSLVGNRRVILVLLCHGPGSTKAEGVEEIAAKVVVHLLFRQARV